MQEKPIVILKARHMPHLKWLIVLFSICICLHPAYSQRAKVELPGTEVLKLVSLIDSQQYVLHIHLPDNYNKTNKNYPVIYVTDGQWFFISILAGYKNQHFDGFVPDLIIVGITWTDNYEARRVRDFTPTSIAMVPEGGNARKFLSVIKNEIIKLIDSTFRVEKSNRAIFGTSLGGLFALYSLFHEPTLFSRYIIVSPSLWWDEEILFKYEKSFAEKNHSLNAKVFLSSGEYEEEMSLDNEFTRFTNQIKASKYKGLEVESIVLDKMGHSGSSTVGGSRGLQFVYSKPPPMMVDTLLLDRYIGRYTSGVDTSLVTRTGNSIYDQAFFGKAALRAETEQRFYVIGISNLYEFKKDNKGKVIGYDLTQNDTKLFYKKID
jgi:predicted alpha/beta superfamily hydrolase